MQREFWISAAARVAWVVVGLCHFAGSGSATLQVGVTSQSFRTKLPLNVNVNQWGETALFNLQIQSGNADWGYDVVYSTNELAPADISGQPSQTGWHDHPTALTIVIIVQGTLWNQQKPNLNCIVPYPTGTVFFERAGEIHNAYNLDSRTPTVLRVIHFIDRSLGATRRDQPDQMTGDPNTASPPPAACVNSNKIQWGEPKLRVIAHELVTSVKNTVTVDWMHREAARARMRVLVKKILRKYGYPPDLQDSAVQVVLQQAEVLSAEWSVA